MFVSNLIRQRFLPRWFRWADVNPRHWRWTLVSNWNRKLWIKGLLLHFKLFFFCFCFSLKNWIVKVSPCLMIWGQSKKHFVKWYRVRHGFRLAKKDDYFLGWLSSIFGGSWGSIEIWLEPKTKPPTGNLACPNPWNAQYDNVEDKIEY